MPWIWTSVAPGRRVVTLHREAGSPAIGQVEIDVVAGELTVVAGLSPAATQP